MNPVTPNYQQSFDTEAEANAFVDGVNYVNDSAVTVLGIEEQAGGGWVVNIHDQDAD